MLGQRQVTPRWADDPVQRHDISWWRGYQVRRELHPPEGHQTLVREDGAGQE